MRVPGRPGVVGAAGEAVGCDVHLI
jgi:hypothetical protein